MAVGVARLDIIDRKNNGMATIDISRSHALGIDTARARAEELAKDMQGRLGIQWSWQGECILFNARGGAARGTTGRVSVSASEVRVEIDLPLLLRAMKGTIAGKVNDKLDKLLG